MTLPRTLEPEVMDDADDAIDYDRMNHVDVNARFVQELLSFAAPLPNPILDVGTGTAQIPIELLRRVPGAVVLGVDAAKSMIELARSNVARAGFDAAITLAVLDARSMPYVDGYWPSVISNSIIHHIPEPLEVLREMTRLVQPGGVLFVRDLARPESAVAVAVVVETYAKGEAEHARRLFRDSLHAALTLDEIRAMVVELGYAAETVTMTSDRHWTWAARGK